MTFKKLHLDKIAENGDAIRQIEERLEAALDNVIGLKLKPFDAENFRKFMDERNKGLLSILRET
jgi:hypothetical protein